MHNLSSIRGRVLALVYATASLGLPAAAVNAQPYAPPVKGPAIEVTQSDVDASNRKVEEAYNALVSMWTKEFQGIGQRFVAPRIAAYEGGARSSCGFIGPNNAEYCARNNTIYFDDIFVTGMEKTAAHALGTDGDMAGLGIIAHEMGHAVAIQLGHESPSSYENESTADCLAGAFTEQSGKDGLLEKGDIDEAFYGMSLAGDPTPQPTGNRRVDAMIQARLARESHGTKEQRVQNFRAGLSGGPAACLDDFAG
ncbi:MAG: neutral zinc metallopeptidase, partial [Gemmatimonadales bacterium]